MTKVGQMLKDFHCFCLRKILWSEVGKYNETGLLKYWYSLLSHIPTSFVYNQLEIYTRRSNNTTSNKVRTLLFPAVGKLYYKSKYLKDRYGMPKSWFLERSEYEFEGCSFFGSKDNDAVLKHFYRDYKSIPTVDKREQHSPCVEILFPQDMR